MLKLGEDYYLNESGFMVFTEEYHLKRGSCCQNNCKHCPWRRVKTDHNNLKGTIYET